MVVKLCIFFFLSPINPNISKKKLRNNDNNIILPCVPVWTLTELPRKKYHVLFFYGRWQFEVVVKLWLISLLLLILSNNHLIILYYKYKVIPIKLYVIYIIQVYYIKHLPKKKSILCQNNSPKKKVYYIKTE